MPSGTILPWWGDTSSIPSGFLLCDGTNGTPNLTGRTLIGSGSWADVYGTISYAVGDIAGERLHKLTIAEIPIHSHTGALPDGNVWFNRHRYTDQGWPAEMGPGSFDSRFTGATGGDVPHNNMMPYMVIHWIIKI